MLCINGEGNLCALLRCRSNCHNYFLNRFHVSKRLARHVEMLNVENNKSATSQRLSHILILYETVIAPQLAYLKIEMTIKVCHCEPMEKLACEM